jgi:hypothetical protein
VLGACLTCSVYTVNGSASLVLKFSEANLQLWQLMLLYHVRFYDAATSRTRTFYSESNDDYDEFTAIVELELLPLGVFQVCLALTDNIEDVADVFLTEHSLSSDLKERIVKELYKVHQHGFSSVLEAFRDLRNELYEKIESLAYAEKSADLARDHIATLSKSLQFLQHSVPALLSSMKEKDDTIEKLVIDSGRLRDELVLSQQELNTAVQMSHGGQLTGEVLGNEKNYGAYSWESKYAQFRDITVCIK